MERSDVVSPGATSPQWSPDGRRIAYVDDGISVMNSDGTGNKRLTRGAYDGDPRWSPGGKQIAFTRDPGLTIEDGNVCVVDAGGGRVRRVTYTGDSLLGAWAPGRKIIYDRYTTDEFRASIYTANADGTGRRRLTTPILNGPHIGGWSPDGRLIVYIGSDGIHTLRPGNGSVRLLTSGSDPTWSPDGHQIAFTRGFDSPARDGLWIVNRDGSHARRVAAPHGRLDWYSHPTWARG